MLLWILAMFCHYEWWTFVLGENGTIVGAMLTLLLAPIVLVTYNRALFALLLCCQLLDAYQVMPAIPNHWLLSAVISLLYLAWAVRHSMGQIPFSAFQHALKWTIIAFYSWAVFWKTNSGFLDAQESCAVVFMLEVPFFNLITPKSVLWLVPAKVLFLEALIPLLLLRRKLWIAVIVGILFHMGLAQNIARIFVNFSSVMLAGLVVASVSEAVATKLSAPLRQDRSLVATGLLVFVMVVWFSRDPLSSNLVLRYLFWTALAIFLVYFIWRNRDGFVAPAGGNGWLVTLGVGLITLNGITPIIGTKTGSAWQMYSNLYIDGESSNHQFVHKSWDMHGALADKVIVKYKDNEDSREMILLTLLQEVREHGYQQIDTVSRFDGGKLSLDELAQRSQDLSWFERKAMRFVDLEGANSCRW